MDDTNLTDRILDSSYYTFRRRKHEREVRASSFFVFGILGTSVVGAALAYTHGLDSFPFSSVYSSEIIQSSLADHLRNHPGTAERDGQFGFLAFFSVGTALYGTAYLTSRFLRLESPSF